MMTEPITSFTGSNRFLSNFWREKDGFSLEHRFQAMKNADPAGRAPFPASMKPGKAKSEGRKLPLRADWETVKLQIMEDLVREKFKDRVLAAELLATGDAELVEGNTWKDTTWGMVKRGDRWVGENHLGKILMKVREELRTGAREASCGVT